METRYIAPLFLVAGIAGVLVYRSHAHAPANASPATVQQRAVAREVRIERPARRHALTIRRPQSPEAKPEPPRVVIVPPEPDETRERFDSIPDAVVVRHLDNSLGVYAPDDVPIDGVILARKLPDGEIGWYAGPDVGPRSDPNAFWPAEAPEPAPQREWAVDRDGTITIDGKPASDAVQRVFGGKRK